MEVERPFTWFPQFTDSIKDLPPSDVAEFVVAVLEYGSHGVEPEFSNPYLSANFRLMREQIDNSVNSRSNNKGGRPRKNPRENGGSEVSKTEETSCEEVSKTENLYQTKPNQTSKKDTPKGVSKKSAPFQPPTPEEVAAYAAEKGYAIDAEHFCDYHTSRGWRVSSSPMRDWRAAVRTWARKDREWAKERGEVADDAELELYASLV